VLRVRADRAGQANTHSGLTNAQTTRPPARTQHPSHNDTSDHSGKEPGVTATRPAQPNTHETKQAGVTPSLFAFP